MFKRYVIVVMALALLATSALSDNWNFDKSHSSIGFSVRHMVISKTRGTFNDYTGQVVFDGKNMDKASVDVTVQIVRFGSVEKHIHIQLANVRSSCICHRRRIRRVNGSRAESSR